VHQGGRIPPNSEIREGRGHNLELDSKRVEFSRARIKYWSRRVRNRSRQFNLKLVLLREKTSKPKSEIELTSARN